MAQIAAVPEPSSAVSRDLRLEGSDPADLIVHWLNSVLLEAERCRAVWTVARVTLLDGNRMEARLEGPRLDPARHVLLREVKAVSHDDLELDLVPPRCRCRLVLDI